MENFITPPNHINFKAKKLFGEMGSIIDGSIAYVDLIDKYYISVMLIILGSGIRLFQVNQTEIKLKLVYTKTYNGITDLVYMRR